MRKLIWKIYYGDGTTFDNTQGSPQEAPAENVQIIATYEDGAGRILLHLWDWYFYIDYKDGKKSEWYGADIHGLLDHLLTYQDQVKAVKQGRSIRNAVFNDLLKKAINDPDMLLGIDHNGERFPKQVYGEGRREHYD